MDCSFLKPSERCDYELCRSRRAVHKITKGVVVFVRHGESDWNDRNLFTGWYDAPLNETGYGEAKRAGRDLKRMIMTFHEAHTSLLSRAQKTLDVILQSVNQTQIPVYRTWRLNERHYGALTGLNRIDIASKYGEEQVKIWRRSYDIPPPPMEPSNPYYDIITNDLRYQDGPSPEEFPKTESLKLTMERTLPYWQSAIVPKIKAKKTLLVVAHGNSLRGLVKHIDNVSDEKIMEFNLPTGIPFIYEFDDNLTPVVSMKFVGDAATVRKANKIFAGKR